MSTDLTARQQEYLDFIRKYIQEYRSAPRLEQIAQNFHVTLPTANKMLKTLAANGYLYFGRDNLTGFYIRLPKWIGTDAYITEIVITGKVNGYGEVFDFPKKLGHFPLPVSEANTENLFALEVWHRIPPADILSNDILIFDQTKEPCPGDICIIPIGERWFLIRLRNLNSEGLFDWLPLAYSEETRSFYVEVFQEQGIEPSPVSREAVLATTLLLKRELAI